jgi:hypothetical protein
MPRSKRLRSVVYECLEGDTARRIGKEGGEYSGF